MSDIEYCLPTPRKLPPQPADIAFVYDCLKIHRCEDVEVRPMATPNQDMVDIAIWTEDVYIVSQTNRYPRILHCRSHSACQPRVKPRRMAPQFVFSRSFGLGDRQRSSGLALLGLHRNHCGLDTTHAHRSKWTAQLMWPSSNNSFTSTKTDETE